MLRYGLFLLQICALYDTIRYIICTEKLTGQFNLAHELKDN